MYWNKQPKFTVGLEFVPGLQNTRPVFYTGRFTENNITYIFEKTLNPTIHTLSLRAGYYFTLVRKKDKTD